MSLPREFDGNCFYGTPFSTFVKIHVYHAVMGLAMLISHNCVPMVGEDEKASVWLLSWPDGIQCREFPPKWE